MSLGKKDISLNIYTEAQILSSDSKKFLNSFLDLIKKKSNISTVKISGFGSFYYKESPQRIGRNPKTKKIFPISKRHKLRFKSSNKIKSFLN